MTAQLKRTTVEDIADLAASFNKLLSHGITFRLDTHTMMDCLNNTAVRGEEVKISTVRLSDDTKTLEVTLDGVKDNVTIDSRKWTFEIKDGGFIHDPELFVTVENVTGEVSNNIPETLPFFLAEVTPVEFQSVWNM